MRYPILVLFLFLGLPLWAQSLKAYEKAAQAALDRADYYNAIYYYEAVLQSKPQADIYWAYARALAGALAHEQAVRAYQKAEKKAEDYPNFYYCYGLSLQQSGQYEQAQQAWEKQAAEQLSPYEKAHLQQCLKGLEMIEAQVVDEDWNCQNMGAKINGPSADYAAYPDSLGRLQFSALRQKNAEAAFRSQLYREREKGKKAQQDERIGQQKQLGASCWGKNFTSRYLTIIEDSSSYLAYSYLQENGRFSLPKALKGLPENSSQPHYYAFGEDSAYLYFVHQTAQQKEDIYWAKIAEDTLVLAFAPLGAQINSPGRELSPFRRGDSLFFASDFWAGYGGLDIFCASRDSVFNLGPGLNSAAHELYFYLNQGDSSGYFASNRKGSQQLKEAVCCTDIYQFETSRFLPTLPPEPPLLVQLDSPAPPQPIGPSQEEELLTALQQALPLALYFHNDEPDSNSLALSASQTYRQSWGSYAQLFPLYRQQNASNLAAWEQFEAQASANYQQLQQFEEQLLALLQTGARVEVALRAYCSPRSWTDYNFNLAQRRLDALINNWEAGPLAPYYASGQLQLKSLPLGESQAPKTVNDRFDQPQLSIFSPAAARERRLEIEFVSLKN